MANRSDLAISELDKFRDWLLENDYTVVPTKGDFEVMRWKGEPGEAMPIIFVKHGAKVHLSCNHSAHSYVRTYLNEKKFGKGE